MATEAGKLARRRRMARAIETADRRLARAISILVVARMDLGKGRGKAKRRK